MHTAFRDGFGWPCVTIGGTGSLRTCLLLIGINLVRYGKSARVLAQMAAHAMGDRRGRRGRPDVRVGDDESLGQQAAVVVRRRRAVGLEAVEDPARRVPVCHGKKLPRHRGGGFLDL